MKQLQTLQKEFQSFDNDSFDFPEGLQLIRISKIVVGHFIQLFNSKKPKQKRNSLVFALFANQHKEQQKISKSEKIRRLFTASDCLLQIVF